METIKNHFIRDMGIVPGYLMCHIFNSRNPIVTITIIPGVLTLLLTLTLGCAILLIPEMFSNIF